MKCPKCNSRKISVGNTKGFSKDPVKECAACGLVWVNDGKDNHILYK